MVSVCSQGQSIGLFKLIQCPLYNIVSLTVAPTNVANSLYAINHQLIFEGNPISGTTAGSQVWTYEVGTDYQKTFTVSFPLKATSQVTFNGKKIRNTQWSGVGTTIITLSLDTRAYDFLSVIQ